MGDPLSTAASIIAVIQISGKVLSVCYHCAASLKHAPGEIQWVINEVGSLKVILEELRALALSVADNERPAVSGKSSLDLSIARSSGRLKRRRDKNAEEHQPGRVSRKKGNTKSSFSSESSQDNHTSLNASNAEPSSLAGFLAASHIENNPPGSDHSALFKSLDAAHGPLKTCESALKAISDNIGTLVGARRPASTLTWLLKEKAVQKILEVIQKQKSNLILALAADGARAIEKIENSLDENAELVSQLFEAIAQNTETTSMICDSIQEANERQQREKILSWLQSTDLSANHAAAWEEHEAKTGDWLLQCESYRQWLESKGQLTWLNGISGCGKTVLTATVLEDVKKYCSTYPDWQYTYYYFDFNDAAKRKPVSMVQSILAQLARSMKPLPEDLTNLYESNASGQHQPSVKSLMPVLASAIQSRPVVYLVVDALDECLEWEELLRAIEALHSSCDNLNIFMSSRREYGLTATLSGIATHDVKIQSAAVDADINLFVQTRLSSDSVLREWPTTVKAEIREALVSGCNGMFRWVVCQLESLRRCHNLRTLRQNLQSLPHGLYETYDRIMSKIPEAHRAEAQNVLMWLTFCEVPLTLGSVADAAVVDRQCRGFNIEDRFFDVHDLLKICSSFVSLAGSKSTTKIGDFSFYLEDEFLTDDKLILRLAHFSVKEYILSKKNDVTGFLQSNMIDTAELVMAETCLIYLLSIDITDLTCNGYCNEYPFVDYAAYYWFRHYDKLHTEEEQKVEDLMLALLNSEASYKSWVRAYQYCYRYVKNRPTLHPPEPPLVFVSRVGIVKAVKSLVHRGLGTAAEGLLARSLFQACWRGWENVVGILLHAGARVDSCLENTPLENTPLLVAAQNGHDKILNVLLDKGMKNSQVDLNYLNCALGWALRHRQLEAAKILVKAGADIHAPTSNMPGHPGWSPFAIAAWCYSLPTVRYLMSKGAGSHVKDLREAKLRMIDQTWSVQAKFKTLQALGAFPDFSFPDFSIPETLSGLDYETWRFYRQPETKNPPSNERMEEWVMREEILKHRRLLEEEELVEKATLLLERIRNPAAPTSGPVSNDHALRRNSKRRCRA